MSCRERPSVPLLSMKYQTLPHLSEGAIKPNSAKYALGHYRPPIVDVEEGVVGGLQNPTTHRSPLNSEESFDFSSTRSYLSNQTSTVASPALERAGSSITHRRPSSAAAIESSPSYDHFRSRQSTPKPEGLYDEIERREEILIHPKPQRNVSDLLLKIESPALVSLDDARESFKAGRDFLHFHDDAILEHIGDDRRARSLSPSYFQEGDSSMSNPGQLGDIYGRNSKFLSGGSKTPAPGLLSKGRKEDKKKHGSYKIWHRNASQELQLAYNAIYGLPLYGSVAFIGKKFYVEDEEAHTELPDLSNEPDINTVINQRFQGPALIHQNIMDRWEVSISSAGKDDGDFAHILVNGEDLSQNKRGFNIVVIFPASGELISECFDTHGLPEEAEKLSAFIANIPIGSYVLGSIRDDGAKFLGAIARESLVSLGVRIPPADDAISLARVAGALPPDRTRVLLTVCAKANAKNCARVLLKLGWDIHTRASHTMNTPLHDAVYQRNTDIAIVLLDCGANPWLENKWGETPENIAQKKYGFHSLAEMIMSNDHHVQSVMRYIGLEE